MAASAQVEALRRRLAPLLKETKLVQFGSSAFEAGAYEPDAAHDAPFDERSGARVSLGEPALDGVLGGGIAPGLHELRPEGYADSPLTLAMTAAFAARALQAREQAGLVVWCRSAARPAQDFGLLDPAGAQAFGLDPRAIVLVEAGSVRDALWTLEESVKCPAVTAVIGEIGEAAAVDLTAERRLLLTARAACSHVFLLRSHAHAAPSPSLTRWRVAARVGAPAPWRDIFGLSGLGPCAARLTLVRQRGGGHPPGAFDVEWRDAATGFTLASLVADRSARPDGEGRERRAIPLRRAG